MNSLRRKSRSLDRLEGSDSKEQIDSTSGLEGSSRIGTGSGSYLERGATAGIRRSPKRQESIRAMDLGICGDFLGRVLRVLGPGLEKKRRGEWKRSRAREKTILPSIWLRGLRQRRVVFG